MKGLVLNRPKWCFYSAPNTGPTRRPRALQAAILLFWRTLFYSEMNHVASLKEAASVVGQAEGRRVTAVLPPWLERGVIVAFY